MILYVEDVTFPHLELEHRSPHGAQVHDLYEVLNLQPQALSERDALCIDRHDGPQHHVDDQLHLRSPAHLQAPRGTFGTAQDVDL